jgi:carboxypeptidase family protein
MVAFVTWGVALPCPGQSVQVAPVPPAGKQSAPCPISQKTPDPQTCGRISGTVVDQSGAVVADAQVKLTYNDQWAAQEMQSGADGQFSFVNVAPGPFHLTVTLVGFAPQTVSGTLHPTEVQIIPEIQLAVAATTTDVEVGMTRTEVAEEEIKVEEKQRVFGVLPNFYVSYVADPEPLTSKQKFEIAWKTVIDPATFIFVGGAAGVEQAQNHFKEYGQGAQGYGERFGAGYADTITSTFIGSALLPSLLKQDPRYFYKGTGSVRSRAAYAIATSLICKGDNGHWQVSYSNILGSLAAGGLSNLYYPSQDRNGAGLTFENGAIGIGATAAANLFQEFIVKKLTPKASHQNSGKP